MRKQTFQRIRLPAILALCMITALAVCLRINASDAAEKLRFVVPTANGEQTVLPDIQGDTCRVFLPSYTDFNLLSLDCPDGMRVTVNEQAYDGKGFFADLKTQTPYILRIARPSGLFAAEKTIEFYRAENIPALSITLADGTLSNILNSPGHKVSKAGKCAMILADGTVDYAGALDSLQGRGNVTWEENKRPYNIGFKEGVNLLKMGDSVKYCLLANALDKSNLRDKLVYDAARKIGLPYSVDSDFVDLYVDGTYCGLYLLTQDVQLRADRIALTDLSAQTAQANANPLSNYTQIDTVENGVGKRYTDIPHNPADITGGYLIELDMAERYRLFSSGFILPNNEYCYTLKSPARASEAELNYVCGLFTQIENDLTSGILPAQIDLDSWVRYYLIQEVFGNFDPCSVYFFKDADSVDGKIYAGPIWDFDKALGSPVYAGTGSPDKLYAAEHTIFQKLYLNEPFRKKAIEVYQNECVPLLHTLLDGELEACAARIKESAKMNALRWQNEPLHAWEPKQDSVEAHVRYVADFLRQRMQYLEIEWCGAQACTVDYASYSPIQHIGFYTLPKGSPLGELPVLTCDGYAFSGWVDADGQTPDPNAPVTDSVFYTATWEKTGTDALPVMLRQKLTDFAESHNWTLRKLWNYAAAAALTAGFCLVLLILALAACKERRRAHKRNG